MVTALSDITLHISTYCVTFLRNGIRRVNRLLLFMALSCNYLIKIFFSFRMLVKSLLKIETHQMDNAQCF